MDTSSIPSFTLYGEVQDFPDLLHLENISERAAGLDWTINIHRHANLAQLLWVASGEGEMLLDGDRRDFGGNTLVFMPPNIPHGYFFRGGTEGSVVTIPVQFLGQAIFEESALNRILYAPRVLQTDTRIELLMTDIRREYHNDYAFRSDALMLSVAQILLWILRHPDLARDERPLSGYQMLYARFQTLLEEQFKSNKSVSDFAAELGVTPTHLNRACKSVTGASVSSLIRDRSIHEAKRLLAYTALTVAEVGYELGYLDPAYFTRVFRLATGQTPKAFRARVQS